MVSNTSIKAFVVVGYREIKGEELPVVKEYYQFCHGDKPGQCCELILDNSVAITQK